MNKLTQSEGEVCPNTCHPEQAWEGDRAADGWAQREAIARAQPAADEDPRLVIRGESLGAIPDLGESLELRALGSNGKYKIVSIPLAKPDAEPQAALTDYLNTTFSFNPSTLAILELLDHLKLYLGEAFGSLHDRGAGLHGYQKSFSVGVTSALFAYGGQRGTAFFSLPGSACALISDWQAVYHLFYEILHARITRWDGAVDVFDGIPSVDDAVAFYQAGLFNAGGSRPSCRQNGNWIEPDGTGRTFYVGKRGNGKTMRIYEKGKQLGDSDSPWVRWELELHNQDREIPWEVILEPGRFVAASYPCMAWVNEIQERIKTSQKTAKISYEYLIHYARLAYGPLINVMLEIEGSAEKVLERLRREGVPARLDLGSK